MKVLTVTNNNNYKLTFKSNPTSEPIPQTVLIGKTDTPADSVQFKQSSPTTQMPFGNRVLTFIKEFVKTPQVDLTQYQTGMTPEDLALTRINLY